MVMSTQPTDFEAYRDGLDATDPEPFRDAADLIDAGGTIEAAYAMLSARHKTTLFRVENRPPLPMLVSRGTEAPALLRKLAADLKDD